METVSSSTRIARAPRFEITMAGHNVTAALTPYLLSATYTDYVEGQSDTLEIAVEDTDGRFRTTWYPTQGDALQLKLGYQDTTLLDCGGFEIDEIELEGPPDTVSIRAVSAGVLRPQRTHMGRAYESTTLATIARQVAVRLKLSLVGTIEAIPIRRVTQINESDLTFLHRLAGEYGYAFSVKGTRLVFAKRAELRAAKVVLTLSRSDLARYRLRDKIMGVVHEAQASYHDPKTKRLRHYKLRDTSRAAASADKVKVVTRAESDEQARAQASSALAEANIEATALTLTVEGDPRLMAGVNFTLTDMGKLSGTYHVVMSRHTIGRSDGYTTEIEAKRVGASNA